MFGIIKRTIQYYRWFGFNQTVKRILNGSPLPQNVAPQQAEPQVRSAHEFYKHIGAPWSPLYFFSIPDGKTKRITLVMNSMQSNHFYGGAGTSVIFAALLAEKLGAHLRVIARQDEVNPQNIDDLLKAHHITLSKEPQIVLHPFGHSYIPINKYRNEQIITNSWWLTRAVLASVMPEQIIYIIQEDERMFYAMNDHGLMCEEIMQNKEIQFVVNTQLLFNHLTANGCSNMLGRGIWFEPAFHRDIFQRQIKDPGEKMKMMFYARPQHERNLFQFGMKVLDTAISQGIIDTDQWDILLLGKDIPAFKFLNGYEPVKYENLKWTDYGKLIGSIDLGLSLMYTPHPSYPPFDLATAGAVAVTNRYGIKQDLSHYSKNILCGDLTLDSMLKTMKQGIALANNFPLRDAQHQADNIGRDWKEAFSGVIQQLSEQVR